MCRDEETSLDLGDDSGNDHREEVKVPRTIPPVTVTFQEEEEEADPNQRPTPPRSIISTTAFSRSLHDAISQHTEIEYYSSSGDLRDEDDDHDDDDGDNEEGGEFYFDEEDEDEDGDNASSRNDDDDDEDAQRRYRVLQRAASRQSIQSVASDAFSLPLGDQDDISSLECEDNDPTRNATKNNTPKDDNAEGKYLDSTSIDNADDISLKEATSGDAAPELPAPLLEVDSPSPRRPRVSMTANKKLVSPTTGIMANPLQNDNFREAFCNANALHVSHSSKMGLDHLVEADNETDDDDLDPDPDHDEDHDGDVNEQEENKSDTSLVVEGILAIARRSAHIETDDPVADVMERMHKSLYLPVCDESWLLPPPTARPEDLQSTAASAATATATTSIVPGSGHFRSASIELEDAYDSHNHPHNYNYSTAHPPRAVPSFSALAAQANLPPELDLVQARKFLAQLAQGVPEPGMTTTPAKNKYTVDDDDHDNDNDNDNEDGDRLGTLLDYSEQEFQTPTARRRQPFSNSAAKSSAMSSEYTEIVIEDDEDEDDDEFANQSRGVPASPAFVSDGGGGGGGSSSSSHRLIPLRSMASTDSASEYTEILVDESTPAPRSVSSRRSHFLRNREASLSYDFTEVISEEEDGEVLPLQYTEEEEEEAIVEDT